MGVVQCNDAQSQSIMSPDIAKRTLDGLGPDDVSMLVGSAAADVGLELLMACLKIQWKWGERAMAPKVRRTTSIAPPEGSDLYGH
jgi:hypothetical protein